MTSEKRKEMQDSVEALAETIAGEAGVELVDIDFKTSKDGLHVIVYIDKPEGVSLKDCEQVNKLLGELLDIKDPIPSSYMLEVSSPGIERPLKKKNDFLRFKGRNVKIKTYQKIEGQKNFAGVLQGLENEYVVILAEDGNRIHIELDLISKAHLWDKK